MTEQEMEKFLRDSFEENFEILKAESGHSITPDVKEAAFQQVRMYWKKLRDVAESVTDTEIRLNLPGQKTPDGRRFSVEGIVDIVQEQDRTVMYDIKTHDADYVRDNIEQYKGQLNIYAHIWQELRGKGLDSTAIIATAPTPDLKNALLSRDEAKIEEAFEKWKPLVEIPFDKASLADSLDKFGKSIDKIEAGEFPPPSGKRLTEPMSKSRKTPFATEVCRNCDARFTCQAYIDYVKAKGHKTAGMRYFVEEFGSDQEKEDWLEANLETLDRV